MYTLNKVNIVRVCTPDSIYVVRVVDPNSEFLKWESPYRNSLSEMYTLVRLNAILVCIPDSR